MVKPLDPEEGTPGRSIGLAESEPLDVPEGRGYRKQDASPQQTTARKKKGGFHRDILRILLIQDSLVRSPVEGSKS